MFLKTFSCPNFNNAQELLNSYCLMLECSKKNYKRIINFMNFFKINLETGHIFLILIKKN